MYKIPCITLGGINILKKYLSIILILCITLSLNGCLNKDYDFSTTENTINSNQEIILQQLQIIEEQESIIAKNKEILENLEIKLETLHLEETKYFIIQELADTAYLYYLETEISGTLNMSAYSNFFKNPLLFPNYVKCYAVGKYSTNIEQLTSKDIDINKENQTITLNLQKPVLYSIHLDYNKKDPYLSEDAIMLSDLNLKENYMTILENDIYSLLKSNFKDFKLYNQILSDFKQQIETKLNSLIQTSSYSNYEIKINFN